MCVVAAQEEEQRMRRVASNIAKDVKKFWLKVDKLVTSPSSGSWVVIAAPLFGVLGDACIGLSASFVVLSGLRPPDESVVDVDRPLRL